MASAGLRFHQSDGLAPGEVTDVMESEVIKREELRQWANQPGSSGPLSEAIPYVNWLCCNISYL